MSSTNKTTYYELPQFVDSDIFNPLVDDNDAYDKIDTALHQIAEAEAGDASEIVSVKGRVTIVEGKVDALETQNGSEILTTTAQTLSGAVNELGADIVSLDGRVDIVEDDINNVNTGLKAKVSALETQNGNEELDTTAQTLSGAVNELLYVMERVYASVSQMVSDASLKAGSKVQTNGYYVAGDGGGAIYNVRTLESEETADGAFLIELNNGLVAELLLGTKCINVKWCGAKGDNVTDDSDAFNLAIAKANETLLPIYLPYGKYVIENDLDPVYVGFCMYADGIDTTDTNHKTIIYDKRSDTSNYLITQDSSIGSYNGGYIQNISFVAIAENNLFCIKIVSKGWDGKLVDCGFYRYKQALYLDGDEWKIDRCSFISCGSKVTESPATYGVLLTGTNEKRFNECHFEHSRFFLKITGNCWSNSFVNCKFEQGSSTYSNFLSSEPIIQLDVTGTFKRYANKFINCDFHCFDVNYYIERLGETSYDNVPYLIGDSSENVAVSEFHGCTFMVGPGTVTPFDYYRQAKFAHLFSMEFFNTRFIGASFITPSIYVNSRGELKVIGCEFVVNTNGVSDYTASDILTEPHIIHAERIKYYGYLDVKDNTISYQNSVQLPFTLANFLTDYHCASVRNTFNRTVNDVTKEIVPKYGKAPILNGFAGDFITVVMVDHSGNKSANSTFKLKMLSSTVANVFMDIIFTLRSGLSGTNWCTFIENNSALTPTSFVVKIYKGNDGKFYIQIPLTNTSNPFIVDIQSIYDRVPFDWYIDRTIYEELAPADYESVVTLLST